tara:strand:+ start:3448 stop:3594 length:147 start_codon:yes stop_codon:yes gene_type:complete
MTKEVLELNSINLGAFALTLTNVNQVLSILVLLSALAYNICKIIKKKW